MPLILTLRRQRNPVWSTDCFPGQTEQLRKTKQKNKNKIKMKKQQNTRKEKCTFLSAFALKNHDFSLFLLQQVFCSFQTLYFCAYEHFACLCLCTTCMLGAWRGQRPHRIPWTWSWSWLWAAMWELFGRAVSALTWWAISAAPRSYFQKAKNEQLFKYWGNGTFS